MEQVILLDQVQCRVTTSVWGDLMGANVNVGETPAESSIYWKNILQY